MNEVAAVSRVPPAVSEPNAIIHMIERVARDPAVDIDKLERLLAMQERVMAQRARTAFATALAEMQPKLPIIQERGKIDIGRGKPQAYALWEDINEAIRPVLAEHGFALSFRTGRTEQHIVVTGVLSHRDGHSEETAMHLPIDNSGSKNAVQAVGSSTSYGKRYTAAALLNLTSRGEDDDGNAAGIAKIDEAQIEKLRELIVAVGADIAKFCKFMKVDRLEDIPATAFDRAAKALEAKQRAGSQ